MGESCPSLSKIVNGHNQYIPYLNKCRVSCGKKLLFQVVMLIKLKAEHLVHLTTSRGVQDEINRYKEYSLPSRCSLGTNPDERLWMDYKSDRDRKTPVEKRTGLVAVSLIEGFSRALASSNALSNIGATVEELCED